MEISRNRDLICSPYFSREETVALFKENDDKKILSAALQNENRAGC